MAMSLPNLHELHLLRVKGISADGVRQLIRHCLGLKVVCLAKCDSIVLGDLLPGGSSTFFFTLKETTLAMIR
ncbi:hypothetical protein BCR42DRAFT_430641 [Absidia repens]|uniref:Uncharacterized protein n=1 Tax=Absidia repens TaxID=90262 RepID=A0A1X2H962_9FUNG|nr:hypothetical protein BCR42DRAFT_430641 [Absidia repens]